MTIRTGESCEAHIGAHVSVTHVPRSVFVIDDDPRLLRLLGLIFRIAGYEVRPFSSARQALAALQESASPPSVVIVDLLMPDMSGREFVRELKELPIRVPVIISSAYGAQAAQRELGTQGAIEKPFSPEALLRLVEEIIGDLPPPDQEAGSTPSDC